MLQYVLCRADRTDPLTPNQASYLQTLADDAGEELDDERLTKAEASKKIDELQGRTGRG